MYHVTQVLRHILASRTKTAAKVAETLLLSVLLFRYSLTPITKALGRRHVSPKGRSVPSAQPRAEFFDVNPTSTSESGLTRIQLPLTKTPLVMNAVEFWLNQKNILDKSLPLKLRRVRIFYKSLMLLHDEKK